VRAKAPHAAGKRTALDVEGGWRKGLAVDDGWADEGRPGSRAHQITLAAERG